VKGAQVRGRQSPLTLDHCAPAVGGVTRIQRQAGRLVCYQVAHDYTSVWQLAKFMKTLVPVDGSPASVRAVKLAVDQVKALPEASLVLLNVQNFSGLSLPEGAGIMPSAWIDQEEQKAAAEALREAVIICRESGISYVTRTERGGVAATIDRVARDEHVQHILMGTRGLGGVRGLLLGSVATQLLHLVDVPVTLVK
jgi:nucleotide-binding universal stress UspA family protein